MFTDVVPPHEEIPHDLVDRLEHNGFSRALPPSVGELEAASRCIVLFRSHGTTARFGAEIVCIVDRVRDSRTVFPLDGARLAGFAEACLPLAGGSPFHRKLALSIVEIAAAPPSDEDRSRLRGLVWAPSSDTATETIHFDATTKRTFHNASELRSSAVLAILQGKPVVEEHVPLGRIAVKKIRAFVRDTPMTSAILALLVLVFFVEAALARSLDPGTDVLSAMGGMNHDFVEAYGEWHRVLTSSLLHGDLVHLLFNALALVVAGATVERLAGRASVMVVFACTAITGSLAGLVINEAHLVSVGASGAIMGLLAAGLVLSWRVRDARERHQLRRRMVGYLVPSLIPLATTHGGKTIDYAAHAGGAVGGILLGGIVLFLASGTRPRRLGKVAAAIAIAAYLFAARGAIKTFPLDAASIGLDPAKVLVAADIPTERDEAWKTVETWAKDRERDPRVHLFRAIALLEKGDAEQAKSELRAAIAEGAILRRFFTNRRLETELRALLAALFLEEGARDEAIATATPVCKLGPGGSAPDMLRDLDVCRQ